MFLVVEVVNSNGMDFMLNCSSDYILGEWICKVCDVVSLFIV